jgi:hypothetical protein
MSCAITVRNEAGRVRYVGERVPWADHPSRAMQFPDEGAAREYMEGREFPEGSVVRVVNVAGTWSKS